MNNNCFRCKGYAEKCDCVGIDKLLVSSSSAEIGYHQVYTVQKPETTSAAGLKHDDGKPAMQFIPKAAMWAMGAAFAHGAKKYGAFNYKNGLAVTRCLAASVRHVYQFLAGEDKDPESGVSHLGHAMASLAMAIDMLETLPQLDDRHKP